MCVEGCLDPDPAPNAVGYFLPGLENQWAACADPSTDQDYDGLDDNCEFKLALTFAPELRYLIGDEVRREPRWAAEWLDGDYGSKTVRIAYLLSYWMDMGDGSTSLSTCQAVGFTFSSSCNGHAGDSEFIRLDVKYNPVTKHWFLADALYSAHEWHVNFSLAADSSLTGYAVGYDLPNQYATMEYPDGKRGGYPRSYVADWKHANYPTDSYCDAHGGVIPTLDIMTDSDDCSTPRSSARVEVLSNRNIGSRAYPSSNCVTTSDPNHPMYSSGNQECYWSSWSEFKGWFTVAPGALASGVYGIILYDHFGF